MNNLTTRCTGETRNKNEMKRKEKKKILFLKFAFHCFFVSNSNMFDCWLSLSLKPLRPILCIFLLIFVWDKDQFTGKQIKYNICLNENKTKLKRVKSDKQFCINSPPPTLYCLPNGNLIFQKSDMKPISPMVIWHLLNRCAATIRNSKLNFGRKRKSWIFF